MLNGKQDITKRKIKTESKNILANNLDKKKIKRQKIAEITFLKIFETTKNSRHVVNQIARTTRSKIMFNQFKYTLVTFTLIRITYIHINGQQIPYKESEEYSRLHLDARLT